jgi:hypothetical protein
VSTTMYRLMPVHSCIVKDITIATMTTKILVVIGMSSLALLLVTEVEEG